MNNFIPSRLILICIAFLLGNIDCSAQLLYPNYSDTGSYDFKIKAKMMGKKAPDWILRQGNFKSLAELKGSVVLLEFSGIGCGACMRAEKDVLDITSFYKEKRFKTVIIEFHSSSRNEKSQISFMPESKYGSFSFIDYNDILKKYGVDRFPIFFLIDSKGVIKYIHTSAFYDNTKNRMIEEINKLML